MIVVRCTSPEKQRSGESDPYIYTEIKMRPREQKKER
jgi:hypothetical protein